VLLHHDLALLQHHQYSEEETMTFQENSEGMFSAEHIFQRESVPPLPLDYEAGDLSEPAVQLMTYGPLHKDSHPLPPSKHTSTKPASPTSKQPQRRAENNSHQEAEPQDEGHSKA
jgi:hypothetical protein